MAANPNETSPDKWGKYDEAFKAEEELLARHGAVHSMSRRGNCYDNAHAELWRWSG